MKITRHTAKDMRQALRMVRDQLGPEAVILTSKRTANGVEVTAAIDFDAARMEAQAQLVEAPRVPAVIEPRTFRPEEFSPAEQADEDVQQSVFARLQAEMARENAAASGGARNTTAGRDRNGDARRGEEPAALTRAAKSAASGLQQSLAASQALSARSADARANGSARHGNEARATSDAAYGADARTTGHARHRADTRATANTRHDIDIRAASDDVHSALDNAIDAYMGDSPAAADDLNDRRQPATLPATNTDNTADSAMGEELRAMRRILENQMAQLAWNDLTRRAPIHTEILRELTEVGLTQDFAAQIVAQLPAGTDITKARRLSIALMSQRINVTGDRWLDKGGRIALVGPTGVGKTTALAKLAVRWVLRHGPRTLALISADSVRIGAHDQMQALGQMLDVPVYVAETLDEIPKLLEQLASQRFVLVDTPGMSQRDPLLGDRMSQIAQSGHGIETALVLSASTQAGANAETVNRFATANVASVLLTKVDEAASLGGILSVLARSELPISYVSEGQRVPEDLRPARALELVSSAVQLAKTSGAAADEDLLRRRYGEVAHALA